MIMKRDNDYLRNLLFEIEGSNSDDGLFHIFVNGLDEDPKRIVHARLLCDSGFLAQESDTGFRLTSDGHDFIEAVRDKSIWDKTKKSVAETGGNITLEMIKMLAVGLLKAKISKHTGIDI